MESRRTSRYTRDFRVGPSATDQLCDQRGVLAGVLESFGDAGDPVKVGADSDVLPPRQLADVVGVICDKSNRSSNATFATVVPLGDEACQKKNVSTLKAVV